LLARRACFLCHKALDDLAASFLDWRGIRFVPEAAMPPTTRPVLPASLPSLPAPLVRTPADFDRGFG